VEEFAFDIRALGAKGQAKQVNRLKNARLPGGVRADEDGEPLQIDVNVVEALEIADRHLADHRLVAFNSLRTAWFGGVVAAQNILRGIGNVLFPFRQPQLSERALVDLPGPLSRDAEEGGDFLKGAPADHDRVGAPMGLDPGEFLRAQGQTAVLQLEHGPLARGNAGQRLRGDGGVLLHL
jgi:hypothetical protein